MASFSPDYYLRQYGSDQVPLSLGALQLEPADRAVLKIAGVHVEIVSKCQLQRKTNAVGTPTL